MAHRQALAHLLWTGLLLAGCAGAPRTPDLIIDCQRADARCHEGRFGLTYRIERGGQVDEDAINGTWRWESVGVTRTTPETAAAPPAPETGSPPEAFSSARQMARPQWSRLELSNVLGVRLATVVQGRQQLILTDSQGRRYSAKDWDDLFQTLFELRLPGEAIARWMGDGAQPQEKPAALTSGWVSDPGPRRLRLTWQGEAGRIRIDFIPDVNRP